MAKTNSKTAEAKKMLEQEYKLMENSAAKASDFIHDDLLPILEEFEFNNDDEEYLSGFATHSLFVLLIAKLGEMGYTEKDLRKEIKTYLNSSIGHVLH